MRKFFDKMDQKFQRLFPGYGSLDDDDIKLLMFGGQGFRQDAIAPKGIELETFLLKALDVAAIRAKRFERLARSRFKVVKRPQSMKRIILAGLRSGENEGLREETTEVLMMEGQRGGEPQLMGKIIQGLIKRELLPKDPDSATT